MPITIPLNTKGWPAPMNLKDITNADTFAVPADHDIGLEVFNEENLKVALAFTCDNPSTGFPRAAHTFAKSSDGPQTINEKHHFSLDAGVTYTVVKGIPT